MRLTTLTKANVDRWFNAKFNKWLYDKSHSKGLKPNAPNDANPLKTDFDGNLEFGDCSRKTKYGIELTENDFIKYELKRLRSFDFDSLDIDHKKQVEFYREFLDSKLENRTKGNPKTEIDLEILNEYPKIFRGLDNKNFETFSDKWHSHILEHFKPNTKASILYHACKDSLQYKLSQSDYLNWVSDKFIFKKPSKVLTEYALSKKAQESLQRLK
jgi:hypothetical protein